MSNINESEEIKPPENENVGGLISGQTNVGKGGPAWLSTFIHADFFAECRCNVSCKSAKNGVGKYFCIDCDDGMFCKLEVDQAHRGHKCLQVRKASKEFSIKVDDIKAFVNLSHIQFFFINNSHIVFIKERCRQLTPVVAPSHCKVCSRSLMEEHAKFCSLECKLNAIRDPRHPEDLEFTMVNDNECRLYGHEATGRLPILVNQHLHYVGHQHSRGKKSRCGSNSRSTGKRKKSLPATTSTTTGAFQNNKLNMYELSLTISTTTCAEKTENLDDGDGKGHGAADGVDAVIKDDLRVNGASNIRDDFVRVNGAAAGSLPCGSGLVNGDYQMIISLSSKRRKNPNPLKSPLC